MQTSAGTGQDVRSFLVRGMARCTKLTYAVKSEEGGSLES